MSGWNAILVMFGGLMGAGGVALGAWVAHHGHSDSLLIASQYFLFHAGPVMAIALHADGRRYLLLVASVIVVGVTLFAGDLTLRGLTGTTIWHLAAPTGGILLITGWFAFALSGIFVNIRRTG